MNKQRLTNTFCEIVKIDSPTGYESEMVDYVFNKLREFGFNVFKDNYGNIIANNKLDEKSVLLTAHLDTVEPGRGISPVIKSGIIKSSANTILGADNKAAVAVILEVAESIYREKIDANLEIIFTLSEEVGNYGAVNLDYSKINSRFGYAFDASGDCGTIITASPFYNRFDVQIVGRSAHASRPEDAKNALLIFKEILNKIQLGRIDEETLCNIGVVSGGSVRNTIPGDLMVKGEVRSFIEEKLELATKNMKEIFESTSYKFGSKLEFAVVRENGGYKLDAKDEFLKHTINIEREIGLSGKCQVSYGVSDANIFADHGLKVINISDGTKNPHTEKEYIAVDDLYKTSQLALELVTKSAKLVT